MGRFTPKLKSPAKDLLPTSRIFEFFTTAAHTDAMLRILITVIAIVTESLPPRQRGISFDESKIESTQCSTRFHLLPFRERIRKRGRIDNVETTMQRFKLCLSSLVQKAIWFRTRVYNRRVNLPPSIHTRSIRLCLALFAAV